MEKTSFAFFPAISRQVLSVTKVEKYSCFLVLIFFEKIFFETDNLWDNLNLFGKDWVTMSILSTLKTKTQSKVPREVEEFLRVANEVILGKSTQVELAFCCLLARGHLLIEDVPGVGKTTLVKFLSRGLSLQESRIQFTNDLLPADIIGTSIFDESKGTFSFHKGPIFGEIIIADELNRATPKTQSACLQAMEERQVSVDGKTYPLPVPFFMVATQNPREQAGTYALPESQLDRFLMRIEMGYPDRASEKALLKGQTRSALLNDLKHVMKPSDVIRFQDMVQEIFVSDQIVDYIQDILDQSRSAVIEHYGLSPRCGLSLIQAAKAWAFMHGRDMVLPEDVQAVAVAVMGHRLNRVDDLDSSRGVKIASEIIANVRVD